MEPGSGSLPQGVTGQGKISVRGTSLLELMPDTPHVLITGAAGFIGASVARVLVEAGAKVTGMDDLSAGRLDRLDPLLRTEARSQDRPFRFVEGDVRDRERLLGTILGDTESPVDSVLHLAGRVGVRRVLQDPLGCEEENLEGAKSLAAAVRIARGQGRSIRVVAASTSEVYAESSDPLSETSALRPVVAEGRWRYAASKRVAEEVIDRVLDGAVHLRFFNVVGPGQDAESGMVLPRFIEAARQGEALRIHGQGSQVRTFAHVDAVARDVAVLAAPRAFFSSDAAASFQGPINVGGMARATIAELAEQVTRAVALHSGRDSAPHQFVDPSVDVAGNFEDVHHRVPDLRLLRTLGLAAERRGSAPWALEDIVRDAVQRHGSGVLACELPVS